MNPTCDVPAAMLSEEVEAALDATDLPWTRRESGWAIPAGARLPREVAIVPEGDGVRVAAVLTTWDEIGATESAALARFFARAQASLRFCRAELDSSQARVVATVVATSVESELADCVAGAATAVRVLVREVAVLLDPAIAAAFLRVSECTSANDRSPAS